MPTHLADTSALARLQHDDVAAIVAPLFLSGRIATCAQIDLELLVAARDEADHAELRADRALVPRVPCGDAAFDRAMEVQGRLSRTGRHREIAVTDLVVAAAAELAGLTVLHYQRDFDVIAEVTGQPTEWVVPAGTVP